MTTPSVQVAINPPPPGTKKKSKDSKNCGLKKCFSALVDRKQVNLELEVLRLMLRKELTIHLELLEPELANLLPYLLVHFIKIWPGWQKSVEYYSGKIPFKTWYDKFHKFITIKLSEVITTNYEEAKAELQREKNAEFRMKHIQKMVADKGSQTDTLAPKVLAPFTIEIMAKPELLNTIVFTDSPEGDVILKQHGISEWDKKATDTITLKQLISWPHVGVHMDCPVFSFSRRNLHEFRRHISLVGTPLPSTNLDFIEETSIINESIPRAAYTTDCLKQTAAEFLFALQNVYKSPAILEAFKTVIDEFIADVEEMNVLMEGKPTIPNNTTILFNMGKNTYFRNKKLSKGSPSRFDIGYTEVIIPKMEVALIKLSENHLEEYFQRLKQFKPECRNMTEAELPRIQFSCSYCRTNFENGGKMAMHLKEEHKMEQPMLCAQCKSPFPAFELSKVRWHHECNLSAKKNT